LRLSAVMSVLSYPSCWCGVLAALIVIALSFSLTPENHH